MMEQSESRQVNSVEWAAMEQAAKDAESRLIGAAKAQTHGVARERTWQEIGIEEKVERLQQQVRALINVVNRQAERLAEAHRVSHSHIHSPLGHVCVSPPEAYMNYPGNHTQVSDHHLR